MSPTLLFKHPKRVLACWALLLALGALALPAADWGLLRYAEHREALDYRSYLARVNDAWDRPGFSPVAAKEAIDGAIRLAPERPEPYVLLGHLHYRLRQWGAAIAAYRAALKHGSEDTGILQNAIWAHIEMGQYAEAAALATEALAEGHTSPVLHRYAGEALWRAGDLKGCLPHLEAALEAFPNDQYLMGRIEEVFLATGDTERAAAIARRIADTEARLGGLGTRAP